MSDPERELPEPNAEPESQPELFRDSFGLKELQSMLEEEALDVEAVLQIVERELLEPAPDPQDVEAAKEYKLKMDYLDRLALHQLGRSAAHRRIIERINEITQQTKIAD